MFLFLPAVLKILVICLDIHSFCILFNVLLQKELFIISLIGLWVVHLVFSEKKKVVYHFFEFPIVKWKTVAMGPTPVFFHLGGSPLEDVYFIGSDGPLLGIFIFLVMGCEDGRFIAIKEMYCLIF